MSDFIRRSEAIHAANAIPGLSTAQHETIKRYLSNIPPVTNGDLLRAAGDRDMAQMIFVLMRYWSRVHKTEDDLYDYLRSAAKGMEKE